MTGLDRERILTSMNAPVNTIAESARQRKAATIVGYIDQHLSPQGSPTAIFLEIMSTEARDTLTALAGVNKASDETWALVVRAFENRQNIADRQFLARLNSFSRHPANTADVTFDLPDDPFVGLT